MILIKTRTVVENWCPGSSTHDYLRTRVGSGHVNGFSVAGRRDGQIDEASGELKRLRLAYRYEICVTSQRPGDALSRGQL
jgi:hypothetical protein